MRRQVSALRDTALRGKEPARPTDRRVPSPAVVRRAPTALLLLVTARLLRATDPRLGRRRRRVTVRRLGRRRRRVTVRRARILTRDRSSRALRGGSAASWPPCPSSSTRIAAGESLACF